MYEAWFELRQRPFRAAPAPDAYFPAASIEAARATITRCIERGEGPAMLAGGAGSGKSLLMEFLAIQFKGRLEPAVLAGGHLTSRRALLQVILFELGLPYRNLEEGELRLSLIEHLSRGDKGTNGLLLLVDEAHTLPTRLLEEIRMITNIVRQGESRAHLVLAGGPALEERLTHPKLDSLSQRLAARCYLEPLSRQETCDYVAHQIAQAGGRAARVFSGNAAEAMYRASAGIPRLINQVADHALMLAFTGGLRQVDAQQVERAWSDLQQLPTPWVTERSATRSKPEAVTNVVEFGELEDEAAASEPAPQPEAEPVVDAMATEIVAESEPCMLADSQAVADRADSALSGMLDHLSEYDKSPPTPAAEMAPVEADAAAEDATHEPSWRSVEPEYGHEPANNAQYQPQLVENEQECSTWMSTGFDGAEATFEAEEVLADRYGEKRPPMVPLLAAPQVSPPGDESPLPSRATSQEEPSGEYSLEDVDELVEDHYAQLDAQKERLAASVSQLENRPVLSPAESQSLLPVEPPEDDAVGSANNLLNFAEAMLLDDRSPAEIWSGEPQTTEASQEQPEELADDICVDSVQADVAARWEPVASQEMEVAVEERAAVEIHQASAADLNDAEWEEPADVRLAVQAASVEPPELIVIDEVPSPAPRPAEAPPAEVRRQEYRQLFSRLRRGQ